jgi:hypothetical protein
VEAYAFFHLDLLWEFTVRLAGRCGQGFDGGDWHDRHGDEMRGGHQTWYRKGDVEVEGRLQWQVQWGQST